MKKILSIILVVLFIFLYFYKLDSTFLLHDERDIVLSGISISRMGKDLHGRRYPLNFKDISPKNPTLAIYYIALWDKFMKINSVSKSRIPNIILTFITVILAYKVVLLLSKNKKIAYLTGLFMLTSPWMFHIGRLAMDIELTTTLIFLGIYLFLKNKRILAYLSLFLSTFSYVGARISVPVLIIYIELFQDKKGATTTKDKALVFLKSIMIISLFFLSYFLIDSSLTRQRAAQETILFNKTKLKEMVEEKRNQCTAPLFMKRIFYNKATQIEDYLLTGISQFQDISFLFKRGDKSPINGSTSAGQFLFPSLLFFYLGIAYLGKKPKGKYFYLLGMIIPLILPSLLSTHGISFGIRSYPTILPLSFLQALGAYFFLEEINKQKRAIKLSVYALLVSSYLVAISSFFFNYFYRRPYLVNELFNEKEKQVSIFLKNSDQKKNIAIFVNNPYDYFLTHLFLSQKYLKEDILYPRSQDDSYKLNNNYFMICRFVKEKRLKKFSKIVIDNECWRNLKPEEREKIKFKKEFSLNSPYTQTEFAKVLEN